MLGLVGWSKSTVYQHMANGTFPAPVRLSTRSVAWRLDDILAWIESRQSARPSASKAV
jgi:prophage regulatory protein